MQRTQKISLPSKNKQQREVTQGLKSVLRNVGKPPKTLLPKTSKFNWNSIGWGITEPLCSEQHWPAQTLPVDGLLVSRLALEWTGQFCGAGHFKHQAPEENT